MPDTELKMELVDAKDDSVPGRDGRFTRYKKYTFYLGKFGPFTERIESDNTDPMELPRRVDALRLHLRQIQG